MVFGSNLHCIFAIRTLSLALLIRWKIYRHTLLPHRLLIQFLFLRNLFDCHNALCTTIWCPLAQLFLYIKNPKKTVRTGWMFPKTSVLSWTTHRQSAAILRVWSNFQKKRAHLKCDTIRTVRKWSYVLALGFTTDMKWPNGLIHNWNWVRNEIHEIVI